MVGDQLFPGHPPGDDRSAHAFNPADRDWPAGRTDPGRVIGILADRGGFAGLDGGVSGAPQPDAACAQYNRTGDKGGITNTAPDILSTYSPFAKSAEINRSTFPIG